MTARSTNAPASTRKLRPARVSPPASAAASAAGPRPVAPSPAARAGALRGAIAWPSSAPTRRSSRSTAAVSACNLASIVPGAPSVMARLHVVR
ncbi:hypothetical protein [Anaeromyxobacter sp. PSR-1]|uniref:hypothetical protein n=1 Tax=Anaeromyxobacter sp. PSR-1 TaxID=1300915 RepID=UPI001ED98FB5|nr:hypothetical protein [Anaeromyxobacter sp. PSR-1]